ncbi:MAG: PIN domain-containing protein [Actinomycetota bacterium]|nr:PIN domain-containing protein [Actinomycetota bacterium]
MTNIIYDAGALIAAERGRREFLAMHQESLAAEIDPIVPAVVLAQVWRGSPGQALLSRVLAGCDIAATGERTARAAGVACGRAKSSDIVDAVVVITAIRLGAPVVTDDPTDLRQLADAVGAPLVVRAP